MVAINTSQIPDFTAVANISVQDYIALVTPLFYFVLGITIYAIFIFKFYKFLAKRDLLELNLTQYTSGFEGFLERVFKAIYYIVENLIIIPLCVFFWFGVLASLLLILTQDPTPERILLIAFSLVAAIRVTSYYNESLSQDVAKMVPFAMLGVFLIDLSFFSKEKTLSILTQLPGHWETAVYYLLFVVMLEFVLRIIHGIAMLFAQNKIAQEEQEFA